MYRTHKEQHRALFLGLIYLGTLFVRDINMAGGFDGNLEGAVRPWIMVSQVGTLGWEI
jgi:hypothetical protein